MRITQEHAITSFIEHDLAAMLIIIMPVSFMIYTSAPTVIIILFVLCGFYHRFYTSSIFKRNFFIFAISLSITFYLLTSALIRGATLNEWNGINNAFPIYLSLIIPAFFGLKIVHNPMRALVLGCRLATIVMTIFSIYLLLDNSSQRNGFGTNPLIAGYIAMIFSCLSRFKLQNNESDRLGIIFFYSGATIAIATGSRIIILFYSVSIVIDALLIFKDTLNDKRGAFRKFVFLLVICLGFASLSIKYGSILRLDESLEKLIKMDLLSDYSLYLRSLMWEFGLNQFIENILFGIGAANIHDELATFFKENYNINFASRHLHNLFIHELVSHGIIGATLIFTFHYLIYKKAASFFKNKHDKLSLILLFLSILIYGLTGSHLTDERMIMLTIFTFAILIKTASGNANSVDKDINTELAQ